MSSEDLERVLHAEPLLAFSLYTAGHSQILVRIGKEITEIFDGWSGSVIQDFTRAYDLFWLWALGAYEIVRTMDEYSACFAPELAARIAEQKATLRQIRVPFAKQQLPGREKQPIGGEPSVIGVDRDFNFEINGKVISAKELIGSFIGFRNSITLAEILMPRPRSPNDEAEVRPAKKD